MTENWKSCLTHFKGDAAIKLFLTSRRGQANLSPIQGTGLRTYVTMIQPSIAPREFPAGKSPTLSQ